VYSNTLMMFMPIVDTTRNRSPLVHASLRRLRRWR
jgi:hypothetical protein